MTPITRQSELPAISAARITFPLPSLPDVTVLLLALGVLVTVELLLRVVLLDSMLEVGDEPSALVSQVPVTIHLLVKLLEANAVVLV